MRFRRALDRANVTEALSAAAELRFVSRADALELTLFLADGDLAAALAELLGRRRSCERIAETLVRWARATS
jgi:hypothetical protein